MEKVDLCPHNFGFVNNRQGVTYHVTYENA